MAEEVRYLGHFSTLRLFCRMDVSVFFDKQSKTYRYVVNEVTRAYLCGMFAHWDLNGHGETLCRALSGSIHYVASNPEILTTLPTHPLTSQL